MGGQTNLAEILDMLKWPPIVRWFVTGLYVESRPNVDSPQHTTIMENMLNYLSEWNYHSQ